MQVLAQNWNLKNRQRVVGVISAKQIKELGGVTAASRIGHLVAQKWVLGAVGHVRGIVTG